MVTNKQQVLDIAMNLNRIGNWAADGFDAKQKRIKLFLDQTTEYIASIDQSIFPQRFILEYKALCLEGKSKPANIDVWAEKMMTWGNILTHRASLLS